MSRRFLPVLVRLTLGRNPGHDGGGVPSVGATEPESVPLAYRVDLSCVAAPGLG